MDKNIDFQKKLNVITAIADDQIKPPIYPVDVYIQEAENLYHWARADKEKLTARGLPGEMVEDLPGRTGALREAESRWNAARFSREEAAKKWAVDSPLAYELRDELLHHFRFAFRKDETLSAKVKTIAEGSSHADMIQDLNDLCILGKENPELLGRIHFDMSLLDEAAQKASEMADLLAAATGERIEYSEPKKIRDQAYTHLKEAVDEIHAYGRYVFRHDEERLKGYRSQHLRRKRKKAADKTNTGETSQPAGEEIPQAGETAR